MAITVSGVAGTVDVPNWAKDFQDFGDARAGMAVMSGLSVSVATGTRIVSVSAGRSVQAGTRAVLDAAQTVTLATNGGSQTRLSFVCLQINWAGTATTAGSLVEVQGTASASPVAPALTQNAGVLWQTPLALVRVTPGVTQILATAVSDARPIASSRVQSGSVTLTPSAADTATQKTVTFPFAFSGTPDIALSLSSAVTGYNIIYWPSNVSGTGFTANLLRGSATATTLTWHAVSAS